MCCCSNQRQGLQITVLTCSSSSGAMQARKVNSSVAGATTRFLRPRRVMRGCRWGRGSPSHQLSASVAMGPVNSTAVRARGRITAEGRLRQRRPSSSSSVSRVACPCSRGE